MKGRRKPRRRIGLRLAFAIAAGIAAHALGGSAQAASTPAASGQPGRIVLAGFTSQQLPVFFKVSADGRKVVLSSIALDMTCTSGAQFALPDVFAKLPVGAAGGLHGGVTQPPTAEPSGDTVALTDSLTGRLNRRRNQVSGVWELKVDYAFTNGMTDHCDSGPVRFTATD